MRTDEGRTPRAAEEPPIRSEIDLVDRIINSTLEDSRVTETVSHAGQAALRELLLGSRVPKAPEVVSAADHEEPSRETP